MLLTRLLELIVGRARAEEIQVEIGSRLLQLWRKVRHPGSDA